MPGFYPARSRGFVVVNYEDSFPIIHPETQASRQPNSNPARLKVRRHSFFIFRLVSGVDKSCGKRSTRLPLAAGQQQ
jgi:hypothetical protein